MNSLWSPNRIPKMSSAEQLQTVRAEIARLESAVAGFQAEIAGVEPRPDVPILQMTYRMKLQLEWAETDLAQARRELKKLSMEG